MADREKPSLSEAPCRNSMGSRGPLPARGSPWLLNAMEGLGPVTPHATRVAPRKMSRWIPRRLRLPACDGILAVYACCKVIRRSRRGAQVEEAIMLKRIAILGALAALTIWNPSHAVAQAWDGRGGGGCCGITVHVGFPNFCCDNRRFFPRRRVFCCDDRRFFPSRFDCCDDRRFFPSRFDCCDDRRFFPRREEFCCDDRRFFPRQVFCCEERRFFPSRFDCCEDRRFFPTREEFCCDDRRFFPGRFGRNWNGDYTNAGYGYDE